MNEGDMSLMDEGDMGFVGLGQPFQFRPWNERRSKLRKLSSIFERCIKGFLFCILELLGLPPRLIVLRPKKFPGRYKLTPYRILCTCMFVCAFVAAVLGGINLSGPSAWLGLAVIITACIWHVNEHRGDYADFAPWFFETDYRTECGVIALLLVHFGIVHLPAIFCIFMPDSFDLEHDWMSILLGSLEFEVKPSAMAPLLRFYATRFRLAQTAGSTLFMEEILVLIPRMAVILTMFVPAFGYIVGMISWILVLGLLLSSGVCLMLKEFRSPVATFFREEAPALIPPLVIIMIMVVPGLGFVVQLISLASLSGLGLGACVYLLILCYRWNQRLSNITLSEDGSNQTSVPGVQNGPQSIHELRLFS